MIIKGKWRWNDYIEDKDENGGFQTQCEFVSSGQVFTDLGFGYNSREDYYTLDYWGKDTSSMQVAASAQGDTTLRLELEEYRIMDFGEAGCEIDMNAYDFIVANAKPVYGIAEKLQMIAENTQSVYDKGKQEGHSEGYQEGLVSGEGYENGYSKAESDFWDTLQNKGARVNYQYAFSRWTGDYFRPKYKIVPTEEGGAKNIFHYFRAAKKLEAKYIDLSQVPRGINDAKSYSYSFCSSGELEEIEDIGLYPSYSYEYAFAYNVYLKKIAMIRVDAETRLANAFKNCLALEEVYFDGEIGTSLSLADSTKLKRVSIENIINHLSDNVSGKTLTLSRTAVDNAFAWTAPGPDGEIFEYGGLEEGSGNAWYPLVASKPNWQITLV
jgi:hypothetical protein